ncbi:MAG: HAD family hydrolase [Acidimicrobiia bacterium]
MIEALVLDFDGVIVDTEVPLFQAWTHTYETFGALPIGEAEWCASLGRNDRDPLALDPLARLLEHLDGDVTADAIQAVRRAERDRLLAAVGPADGLDRLLEQAERSGVPVAIASSSPQDWLERHLVPLGLHHRFAVLSCAGGDIPGKPDPAVYRIACNHLGVDPSRALAVEDSPHGVAAAKAAGMICIAVPTSLSVRLDLSHADGVVESLADIDLRHPLGTSTPP